MNEPIEIIAHYAERINENVARAAERVEDAASRHATPSAVYRPALSLDGNQWCAIYGDDLQSGVAGFGKSPAEAMAAFDKAWVQR